MKLTKRNLFFFIILISTTIISFYLITNYLNNKNESYKNDNISNVTSYTKENNNTNVISYTKNNSISNNINFSIDTANLGLTKSNKTIIEFSSKMKLLPSINAVEGNARLFSPDFEIYVFAGLGETGGLKNSVSISDTFNQQFLNKQIFKVKTSEEHLYYAGDFNEKFNNFYFYTDRFNTGQKCKVLDTQYDGCGSQEITFLDSNKEHSIGIYCAATNIEAVSYCDEFVKNLHVEIKEVQN